MKPALTPARAARAVAAAGQVFEVPPREIIGRLRLPAIVRARQALTAALYQTCATSYPQLGQLLNRDHTTVLYSVRVARQAAATDPDYAERLACIVDACRA